jgi:4'-phosphopantetheinyl transferase EntD
VIADPEPRSRARHPGVLLAVSDAPVDPREMTPGEAAQLASLSGERRRRLWFTGRRALRRALGVCGQPVDTSMYGFPNPIASLSHSAEFAVAAVLVGDAAEVVGVGVDVELDCSPDPRTASFFLTDRERAWLETVPSERRADSLVRLWTVKEALFKADPDNASTVLRDYAVHDPAAHNGRATRMGARGPEFCYVSLAFPRGTVSVAVALSDFWRRDPMQTVDFDTMASRISTLISVPVERLTPEATVAELVPDSFMFVEVAVDLQEEYDVVLSQDDLKTVHTLDDLAVLLRSRQSGQAGS